MEKVTRDFKGVWIPREIWLDENLTWMEKLLFVEINSLDRAAGCWATNAYFADFFGLSKGRISKIIASLNNKGYITLDLVYKPNSKEVDKRVVRTSTPYNQKGLYPMVENVHTPMVENSEDNNTSINNTSNKRHIVGEPDIMTLEEEERLKGIRLFDVDSLEQPDNTEYPESMKNRSTDQEQRERKEKVPQKRKERERILYAEILEYLNEKTGKRFRYTSVANQKVIAARWNEGYRLEDFQKVIDNKAADWLNDPAMVDYLRPSTLFGNKFDMYLNQKSSKAAGSKTPPTIIL